MWIIGRKKTSIAKIKYVESGGNLPSNLEDFCKKYNLNLDNFIYRTKGGGTVSSKDAIVQALIRYLILKSPEYKKIARKNHRIFDSRQVERKKPGRTKARKSQPYLRR